MRDTIETLMPDDSIHGVMAGEPVSVGAAAPDFELPALIGGVKKPLRLSSYRGQKIVLAFYPYNWRDATARQLVSFQLQRPRLIASKAELVAITVDSIMNTTSWEREIGPFDFPICADFWPHGEVCMRYGVLRETGPDAGSSEQALFVVDRDGRVAFRRVYNGDGEATLEHVFPTLEEP